MSNEIVDTVIIGAGMAGCGAAWHLIDNGYTNFLLVEGSDRIGGRMRFEQHGDHVVEYGAQYIHGQRGNPIFEMARDLGLLDEQDNEIDEKYTEPLNTFFWTDEDDQEQIFYDQNGEILDKQLAVELNEYCDKLFIELDDYLKANGDKINDEFTIGDYLLEKFDEAVAQKKFSKVEEKYMPTLYSLLLWRAKFECLYAGCASTFNASLRLSTKFVELDGNKAIQFKKDGYKSLLDAVLAKYGDKFTSRLRLGHKLNKISVNQSDKSVVLTFDDKAPITCRRVLCTMSLGFLKENIQSLIEPVELVKPERLDAIRTHGFGTVNKIMFEFEEPFFTPTQLAVNLAYRVNTREELLAKMKAETKHEEWWESINQFEPHFNNPNIMIIWMSGPHAYEELSDDEILDGCIQLLGRVLKRNDIPRPKKMFRSRWHSDPLFCGSYTFYSITNKRDSSKTLAEPINLDDRDIILFGGEATHSEFSGTVHGAYLSGVREAKRILTSL